MSKILRGALAAALLASIAACTTAPAQQSSDLTPPPRKLDAKTQLECGSKKGC